MILMRRGIRVLVGVGISLRWESVHLLVDLLAIYIDLRELFLAAGLVSRLLEQECLPSKCSLQLGRLWVESVVILPLVF